MKKLLLILLIFTWLQSPAPNLPTTNLCLSAVVAVTGGTCLTHAFTNANPAYFDPAYAIVGGDWLSEFRNYGAAACPSVGDNYLGGVVAYVCQSGDPGYVSGECHGVIATIDDHSTGIAWDAGTRVNISTSSNLMTGTSNTSAIISGQGAGSYAAQVCSDLTTGGYSDWVLPSQDDLQKINLNYLAVGGLTYNSEYWSSTQSTYDVPNRAMGVQITGISNSITAPKSYTYRVRPVRYF